MVVPALPDLKASLIGVLSRSEEHTSELQSLTNLVCRLLLEKKKTTTHWWNVGRFLTHDPIHSILRFYHPKDQPCRCVASLNHEVRAVTNSCLTVSTALATNS